MTISCRCLLLILFLFTLSSNQILAKEKEFVVGVEDLQYYPLYTITKSGEYGGYGREVLDEFSKKMGYRFIYKPLPLNRLFKSLVDGEIDFKFPDNAHWQKDVKKGSRIYYSQPVVNYIDGVMVLEKNRGKGLAGLKSLGAVQGFTPQAYLGLIKTKQIELFESYDFASLIKQLLLGRVDGVYADVVVSYYFYNKLDDALKSKDKLVFDPDLPHTKGSFSISSAGHPKIIEEFNEFLVKEKAGVDLLKNKFKVEDRIQ